MSPAATDAEAGLTVIDWRVAAVMVSWAIPLMAPCVAVIVIGPPVETPFAKPLLPAVLLMVAIDMLAELHVTELVMPTVELSL